MSQVITSPQDVQTMAFRSRNLQRCLLICVALFSLSGCERDSAQVVSLQGSSSGEATAPSEPLINTPTAEPRPALDEGLFTLELKMVRQTPEGAVVQLHYHRREHQVAPRTAEVLIEYPEELTLSGVTGLEATTRAQKDLIVQHPTPGRVRLVWMSIGHLGTIDSGPLAELTFSGAASARSAVHILSLPQRPWFAPAAANDGVMISEPLQFKSE